MAALDADSGRTVVSPPAIGVPRGAEYEVRAASSAVSVDGGQSVTIEATVSGDETTTLTPVVFSAPDVPDGLHVSVTPMRTVPTAGGTPVEVSIEATDTARGGTYPVSVVAAGGGVSRTLKIDVTIRDPDFTSAPVRRRSHSTLAVRGE